MARRGSRYGYGSYRGRSRGRTAMKVVVGVLAVVLAAVLALFFLQEDHMVFTKDGPHLSLPFLDGKKDPDPTPPEGSEPIVVVTTAPTPTPEPEQPVHAALLPRTALSDGTAAAQLAELGADTAVFDMKADDGSLGYVSDLETAKQAGASASDAGLNAAVQALNGTELHTVARVSCFRDNKVPYAIPRLGIKTNSGYNWRDSGDVRWLSPTSAEARQYVTDVCVELAKLGFDEILLDNCGYPTSGHLGYIKVGEAYDAAQFQTVVSAFYYQIKAALAPYPDVKLSIRTSGGVLTGGFDEASGQSVAALLRDADRIWADLGGTSRADAVQALKTVGAETPDCLLVTVGTAAGSAAESWAILNEI